MFFHEPGRFIRPKFDRESDREGLNRAYASTDGLYVDRGVLYVAGTRLPFTRNGGVSDLLTDITIPFGMLSHTPRYQSALAASRFVDRVVGHSLGGAIALQISRDTGIPAVTYGAPSLPFTSLGERHNSLLDPVSFFDVNAIHDAGSGWNPHGFR